LGKRRFVDSSSLRLRRRYAEAAANRAQAFDRWCANSGVQAFTMTTNTDPIMPLIELFSRRARQRGAL
jgi:hypothetical protein